MRHATDEDLDGIDDLLARLRTIEPLQERKRGNFQLRSRAFLHFHIDGDDVFADVRLDGEGFTRLRVTARAEQTSLVSAVTAAVTVSPGRSR
jgi:hypothetical protein